MLADDFEPPLEEAEAEELDTASLHLRRHIWDEEHFQGKLCTRMRENPISGSAHWRSFVDRSVLRLGLARQLLLRVEQAKRESSY